MTDIEQNLQAISKQTVQRLPYYYSILKKLQNDGIETVSAATIASKLQKYEIQVRKDLASISTTAGKPRVGFRVQDLIQDIEKALGYNNVYKAVLVGVGQLGKALLSYKGFEDYGLDIIAAFDVSEGEYDGRRIYSTELLKAICEKEQVNIAIITVPVSSAQSVCNTLVEGGIKAIWNFAPVHLNVSKEILVQNENMAASLALLSNHLAERLNLSQQTDSEI